MTHTPAIAPKRPNKRAIVLPGGGMRVAYQAGALQRLHEEGLRFSLGDGTSGGVMNLGAVLSGVTPADLAMRWRSLKPAKFISPLSIMEYLKFPNLRAFGDFDGIVEYVYPHLGIDPGKIRASRGVQAQFNLCDFAAKSVVPVPQNQITLDQMLAGMSLPMFTPAVPQNGTTWTDAVWIKDANLLETVRNGAREIWVIWCIGNTPRFLPGTLNQYVHMIEMSAVAALNAELEQIRALNAQIAAGETPYGLKTPIKVHLIKPELPIPLDPDFVSGKVSGDALVDQGYMDAAAYLRGKPRQGISLSPAATRTDAPGQGLTFRERMTGRILFGETDPKRGGQDINATPVALQATINLRDVAGFVKDPAHRGEMAAHLFSPRLGFVLPATHSNFQLFSPSDDPDLTHMVYQVGVLLHGKPHWFNGQKQVRRGPPWRIWRETTTLFVRLHEGRDSSGKVVAAGVLRLSPLDFLKLSTTVSTRDCFGPHARLGTVGKFVRFFTRSLWNTYFWQGRRR